jgi:hypothetical protein
LNGVIDSDGYGTISSTGFYLANNSSMSGPSIINGSGNPNISGSLTGLLPNTTYWYQTFANNEMGRSSLPTATSFTTLCETAGISFVSASGTSTSVNISYNITNLGGASNVTRGVCISSTNTNPEIGGANVTSSPATSQSTMGAYTVGFSGLTSRVRYYFKGYVTNCFGTTYSSLGTYTAP